MPTTDTNPVERGALALVTKLVNVGIDGFGPMDAAADVAEHQRAETGDAEDAIDDLVRSHGRLAAVGGFATGLGGFVTLPVALPANVVEFYLVATRMVAGIAHLRGYDVSKPEVRSAVLLTLIGTDSRSMLTKVGLSARARAADVAMKQLPPSALMVLNKGIGLHLLTQLGKGSLARLGKVVPLAGGVVGASLDWWLLRKIGLTARAEFTQR